MKKERRFFKFRDIGIKRSMPARIALWMLIPQGGAICGIIIFYLYILLYLALTSLEDWTIILSFPLLVFYLTLLVWFQLLAWPYGIAGIVVSFIAAICEAGEDRPAFWYILMALFHAFMAGSASTILETIAISH